MATFRKLGMNVSGDWVLDEHYVSAAIPSEHGKVKVTVNNSELPLPASVEKTKYLEDGLSTKIFYNSNLSIDCVPDDDYSAKFMYINNESKPVDA